MSLLKKAGILVLAVILCIAVLGLLFYLYFEVKDYRISLAVTAVLGAGLLIFQYKSKRKSKY